MNNVVIQNQFALTIKEALPIIKSAVQNNYNILLQSSPGLGKTQGAKEVVSAEGMELYIEHASTAEPSDYRGLGFPSADRKSAEFLPYGLLNKMIHADKPLVVFFDDLGGAMQSNQLAIAQIIEERRINNHFISKHVRFIAATNRKQDNAGANQLITMLLSRFKTILEIKPDADAWCEWAVKNNMPPVLIAFLRINKQFISTFDPSKRNVANFACPRTIEALGKWINAGVMHRSVWAGCVGESFAVTFGAFYDTYTQIGNLPANIAKGIAPTSQQAAVLQNPDVQFMVCAALSQLATKQNINNIAAFIKTLSPEFENYFYTDAAVRDVSIRSTSAYIEFATRNQGVI